jgi:hypothetical protein
MADLRTHWLGVLKREFGVKRVGKPRMVNEKSTAAGGSDRLARRHGRAAENVRHCNHCCCGTTQTTPLLRLGDPNGIAS